MGRLVPSGSVTCGVGAARRRASTVPGSMLSSDESNSGDEPMRGMVGISGSNASVL